MIARLKSICMDLACGEKVDYGDRNSRSDPAVRKGRIPGVDAGMGVSGHVTGSEALILYGNFSIFSHNLLYYLCELPNLRNTFYKGISL